MSGSTRTPWHHHLVGAAVRIFLWCGRVLPGPVSYALADCAAVPVALFFGLRDRAGRRSGGFHRNCRIVFREALGHSVHRGLLWRWARHMTHLAIDFCRMPLLTRENLAERVDFAAFVKMEPAWSDRTGMLCATGHVGIPDLTAHVGATLGHPLSSIYSPSPFAPVTAAVSAVRASSGQKVILKEGALREARRAVDRGDALGVAVDVSARHNGVFAPFLGTLARTNATVAALHRRTGRPVIVATCQRVGRGRYKLCVWDNFTLPPTDDKARDLEAIMTRINRGLSRAILAYPEQWFWHGRRFRRRPPGEEPGPDGLPPVCPGAAEAFWAKEVEGGGSGGR